MQLALKGILSITYPIMLKEMLISNQKMNEELSGVVNKRDTLPNSKSTALSIHLSNSQSSLFIIRQLEQTTGTCSYHESQNKELNTTQTSLDKLSKAEQED